MSFAEGENLRVVSSRQRDQFETVGQMKMLRIAEDILDALACAHEQQICHRDVKDANVLVTTEADSGKLGVTLVDFGMCKGLGQPADAETFWGAGSSRFSPPSKLKYPRVAVPNHDVFAVGVLSYLLLTNFFPWDYPPDADTGKLLDLMVTVTPPTIQQLNNKVRRDVSELFRTLLDIDDAQRPSAQTALTQLRVVKARMEHMRDGAEMPHTLGVIFPRVVRDPTHSDIPMSEFEWELMNTPEFQRLRWIRQLGTSHLVYPGAEHSRFSHAVGTMRVASEIMRRYEERTGVHFNGDERQITRAYALLHDVSHIPYGHALEDEMGIFPRHDQNKDRIERLLSPRSELGRLLASTPVGRAVRAYFDKEPSEEKHPWISQLIEGPCGADVLDYVDRDSYHCGLDHRIDSAIYRRFSIQRTDVRTELYGHHGVRLDAGFALESILRERFALFLKVYAHPVKVAAGAMIGKAVCNVLATKGKPKLDEPMIEWMGDHDLLHFLQTAGRTLAKALADMVVGRGGRHLWKPAFGARVLRENVLDETHYQDRLTVLRQKKWFETNIAKSAGIQPEQVIFYCPWKAPGLQRIRQYVGVDPATRQLHRDEEQYRRIYSAHLNLWTAYVFAPPELDRDRINRIAMAAQEVLELENEVDLRPKQLALFV